MNRFGKIVNNEVEWAPFDKQQDKQWCYANGYQPTIETPQPADFDEYEYSYSWKDERKTFIKVWSRGEKKPDTREPYIRRKEQYDIKLCVPSFGNEGELLTITAAASQYLYYLAEGNDTVCDYYKRTIAEQKDIIRQEIPDINE